MISFFEPTNQYDTEFELDPNIKKIETSLLIALWVDLVMESVHRFHDSERNFS